MKIQIEMKNVYGKTLAYPVGTMAQGFAKVANQKTLTRHTLCAVLAMGFEIELMARGVLLATFNAASASRVLATID